MGGRLTDVAVASHARGHEVARVITSDRPAAGVVCTVGYPGTDPRQLERALPVVAAGWWQLVGPEHGGTNGAPSAR
jgi:hypothetical protein